MPGLITHTLIGIILGVIGRFYYKKFFDNEQKKQIILVITCLFFSIIIDFFLAIYYTTHLLPFEILAHYHTITHISFIPIGFFILILALIDNKRKPYWIMGFWAITLHLIMDLYITETGALF